MKLVGWSLIFFVEDSTFWGEIAKSRDVDSSLTTASYSWRTFSMAWWTKKGKMPCHPFCQIESTYVGCGMDSKSLVGKLYFLTNVCISLIEMNVILVIVDIQNIHENKNMTLNLRKLLTIVDDLFDLKWLIIWNIHMNIHIVPLYVVSFKLNPNWHNKFLHLYMDISWWGNYISDFYIMS
jgi:hypothetical protein